MILDVTRSFIRVEMNGRTVSLPGEMFFPPNDKIGFALSLEGDQFWDPPYQHIKVTAIELNDIVKDIRDNFALGGHVLEIN